MMIMWSKIAKIIKHGKRREPEIADVNNAYLRKLSIVYEEIAWAGEAFNSLMHAIHFVQIIKERQELKISPISRESIQKKFINKKELHSLAAPLLKGSYGQYFYN